MEFIPVSKPDLSDVERDYLLQAYDSSWISSTGKFLDRFEREMAEFAGTDYALGVSNGTVALHLALAALNIGPGDEVVVPSCTYIATANAVRYCGAEPVFADIELTRWGLAADSVEAAVTPQTRAIIAVHLYGQPADMSALRLVADRHSLALIEDAAEAPGASIDSRPVGSLADVATFSFYGNKVITSGEGGAVTTDDEALARKMRLLRGQGMAPDRRYWFPVVGYNYRMTNLAAAILCGQLSRFDELMSKRWEVFSWYESELSCIEWVETQPQHPDAARCPWLYCLLLRDADVMARDDLAKWLLEHGIDSRPFFIPLHELPPYVNSRATKMENTLQLSRRGMNLPTYPGLSKVDVERVCSVIAKWRPGT